MFNKAIREALKSAGIKHWELAVALGISETTLVRMLRLELPAEKQDEILRVIESMKAET